MMPRKAYRAKHPDKIRVQTRAQMKAWRAANPARDNATRMKSRIKRLQSFKGRATQMLKSAQMRAAKKGLAFNLDLPWVLERIQAPCELTGLPFELYAKGRGFSSPSIDRRDNSKGYTKDNCRVISWAMNCALHTWGEELYRALALCYLDKNP